MKSTYTVMGYARGLTVLVMPAVHAVMVYGSPSIYHTVLVYLLRFFAEGPGAQLFMFNMGFFLAMKKPLTGNRGYKRGIQLLLAGYGLNAVRMYLPGKFGWLPASLVAHYTVVSTTDTYLPLLLMGDILQFAGIGYVLMSWIHHNIKGYIIPVLFFGMIACITPFCWGIHSEWLGVNYILGLFFAEDARAFFPVFPWLCYPLAGYTTGQLFKRVAETDFYRLILQAGWLFLLIGIVIKHFEPLQWELDFYRSGPGTTIAYTGFQLVWIYFIKICMQYLPCISVWKRLLLFCSKQITLIYLIHWVLIGWGIGLIGYQNLGLKATCLALSVASILSFTIVYFIQRLRTTRLRFNQRQ